MTPRLIILAAVLIGISCQAQSLFVPGSSYTAGQLVRDTVPKIWRAKVNIAKANAWPKAGTYWEAYVLTVADLQKQILVMQDSISRYRLLVNYMRSFPQVTEPLSRLRMVAFKDTFYITGPPYGRLKDY